MSKRIYNSFGVSEVQKFKTLGNSGHIESGYIVYVYD